MQQQLRLEQYQKAKQYFGIDPKAFVDDMYNVILDNVVTCMDQIEQSVLSSIQNREKLKDEKTEAAVRQVCVKKYWRYSFFLKRALTSIAAKP